MSSRSSWTCLAVTVAFSLIRMGAPLKPHREASNGRAPRWSRSSGGETCRSAVRCARGRPACSHAATSSRLSRVSIVTCSRSWMSIERMCSVRGVTDGCSSSSAVAREHGVRAPPAPSLSRCEERQASNSLRVTRDISRRACSSAVASTACARAACRKPSAIRVYSWPRARCRSVSRVVQGGNSLRGTRPLEMWLAARAPPARCSRC